jgi:hypothetical protein
MEQGVHGWLFRLNFNQDSSWETTRHIGEAMSKESLSVKDFSWKQQLGDHQAFGETMSKESLSIKDFSWKQQLGDH